MWSRNKLTERLKLNWPILQAPMGAGLQALYDAADLGPVPPPRAAVGAVDPEHLEMLLAARPEVVSFHFGVPGPEIIAAIKGAGCFIIASATTVSEARDLEAAGIDAIIAQGAEAGGHRGTFSGIDIRQQPGLFSLLPQVVDAVALPVIAAGGIADGRGIAAALMLGASAVQLGTAFLRCEEAQVSETYRAALAEAGDDATVVTAMASGKPARMIRNRLVDQVTAIGAEPLPFPAQYGLTGGLGAGGDKEMGVIFAGQSVALGQEMSAQALVESLAEATSRQLASFD